MSGPAATGRNRPIRAVVGAARWVADLLVGYVVGLVTLPVRFVLFAPLVAVGRSWRSRHFGALCLCGLAVVGLVVASLAGALDHDWPDWVVGAVFGPMAVLLVGGLAVLLPTRPRACQNPAPGLWSVASWVPAEPPSRWTTYGSLFPETDLIRLGVAWVTRVDPWMSRAEARLIRRVMRELLAEMDADPGYRDLVPIWWALEFVLLPPRRWPPPLWHYFAYLPPAAPGERLATLVFLHGHGPNLALYLHAWRRFADEHRFAVYCPSFGYGNWEHPDGVQTVAWALETARASAHFDEERVYLAGLSQGGAGVGRAGAAMPGAFAGLVFLSPTMEPDVLGSPAFVQGWVGRPVLVVQGGRDHNVKPATVDAAVGQMRANGAGVTYHRNDVADHFLFFAQLEAMHRLVGGWMGGRGAGS